MADELAKVGIYLDEFNKIKILEPAVYQQANHLMNNCHLFDENVKALQQTIDSFVSTLTDLGDNVDKEKMVAIGLRNTFKSIIQDRERQQQKLQALIMEKMMELERLQLEYHSLQLLEVEQQELIEYLSEMR